MPIQVTWLGHATWLVNTGTHTLLIDPYLTGNPVASLKAEEVQCDFILLTHGHFDHMTDAAPIAKRCGAPLIANFDLCQWFAEKQGMSEDQLIRMNLGGSLKLPFGQVKMTVAMHSSMLPDGTYGGNPCGFVLILGDKKLYLAGDTALFSDLKLIGDLGLELAVLPIGDVFTMGPEDALEAVKLLRPKQVLPTHYNTWPPIAQDAKAWRRDVLNVTGAIVSTPLPGESIEI